MGWFEDSELDAHLNEHIGVKGNAVLEEQLTTQRPGRRGEFLGAICSISGLITSFLVALAIAIGEGMRRDPPYGVPLSESLLVLFWFCGSVLGLVGAWEARNHRRAGGLALIIAGLLPLVSYFLLFPTSDYSSLLWGLVLLQWWSMLLVFAGIRALSDFPRPALKQN